ncbi:YdiU family protein [Marinicella sediminis]|uniref:Protein nucleotidyltransferase YdiU n=1 Tax=Marinicella sediminis TaxID=1792834 RepID=A0ABV7J9E3_9GAMM|nr:YdiU family protein [Marinicella sediminis]
MSIQLTHQYLDLGQAFSRPVLPESFPEPKLLLWNTDLADELAISVTASERAQVFSGQLLASGSRPVAMAYSGHQFGQFNPQLGDGRAHLLGEHESANGQLVDIHLKGSGRTPFSRNGDGKCGIRPAVREYLMSEAMHALGVPTCRTLAVVSTGETVFREQPVPGAVVTRTAESHIRVGTFEHFAARNQPAELSTLVDFCISRHDFDTPESGPEKYLRFFSQVIDKQIKLLINWMRVGFIHGVMNTDNCLISGHTIDYGPCAMLGVYDPQTVYSSIDHQGRYAFGNQPAITHWNLARLAECLLPLIADDQDQAVHLIMPYIEGFSDRYNQAYRQMMAHKLGFNTADEEVSSCADELLKLMHANQMDYTHTMTALLDPDKDKSLSALNAWLSSWQQLLHKWNINKEHSVQQMKANNPLVIPRNHHVERILKQVEENGDLNELKTFLKVLKSPYQTSKHISQYQDLPTDQDQNYQTYCGT